MEIDIHGFQRKLDNNGEIKAIKKIDKPLVLGIDIRLYLLNNNY